MSGSFHLIQMRPRLDLLLPWALRWKLVPQHGRGDLGYAFHAALAAAFDGQVPQPFSYRAGHGLLAYTDQADALKEAVAQADPDITAMLGITAQGASPGWQMRPFPQAWRTGQTLAFDTRVRPVVRTRDGRERDAYLAAIDSSGDAVPSREQVYADWLRRQFAGAAQLHQVGMTEFRLSDVLRRGSAPDGEPRNRKSVAGPDAVFTGVLQVVDGPAFAGRVARGIGRHRAFGFGMLLLKPAASDWG